MTEGALKRAALPFTYTFHRKIWGYALLTSCLILLWCHSVIYTAVITEPHTLSTQFQDRKHWHRRSAAIAGFQTVGRLRSLLLEMNPKHEHYFGDWKKGNQSGSVIVSNWDLPDGSLLTRAATPVITSATVKVTLPSSTAAVQMTLRKAQIEIYYHPLDDQVRTCSPKCVPGEFSQGRSCLGMHFHL